jgi:hypothetical protein
LTITGVAPAAVSRFHNSVVPKLRVTAKYAVPFAATDVAPPVVYAGPSLSAKPPIGTAAESNLRDSSAST